MATTFAGTLGSQDVREASFTNPYSSLIQNSNRIFNNLQQVPLQQQAVAGANYKNEGLNNTRDAIAGISSGSLTDLSQLQGRNVDTTAVANALLNKQKFDQQVIRDNATDAYRIASLANQKQNLTAAERIANKQEQQVLDNDQAIVDGESLADNASNYQEIKDFVTNAKRNRNKKEVAIGNHALAAFKLKGTESIDDTLKGLTSNDPTTYNSAVRVANSLIPPKQQPTKSVDDYVAIAEKAAGKKGSLFLDTKYANIGNAVGDMFNTPDEIEAKKVKYAENAYEQAIKKLPKGDPKRTKLRSELLQLRDEYSPISLEEQLRRTKAKFLREVGK